MCVSGRRLIAGGIIVLVRDENGAWYRRFAEVPGVGYEGDLQLRSRLAGRDVTPSVHRFEFDGRLTVGLSWPTKEGSSGASPVHELAFGNWSDQTSPAIRERVLSALELPGQLSDYHFVIQSCADALWKRRRNEPWQVAFVEWLCWWDVRLVEAHSHIIEIAPGKQEYLQVLAFDRLVDLYEREGFLHEALATAERFARFRPNIDTVSELRTRVARLRAEHA